MNATSPLKEGTRLKILGVDTSAKTASAAIYESGKLLGEIYADVGLTHSETALPMVKALLDLTRVSLRELDLLAVSTGPGSFTGLRIGIAAVQGISVGSGIPCASVSTLEALAWNLQDFDGVVCPVMDARREQVYTALFRGDGEVLQRIGEDRAVSLEQLGRELSNLREAIIFVGDGAEMCYNKLVHSLDRATLAIQSRRMQRASSVCRVGESAFMRQTGIVGPQDLTPSYLRLPQAERERNERLARQENSW